MSNTFVSFNETITEFLINKFQKNLHKHALWINGSYYSYQQLLETAQSLSSIIDLIPTQQCAIFSSRNILAYTAIFAVLLAGKTYVILNTEEPIERLKRVLELSSAKVIIVDRAHAEIIESLIISSSHNLYIIFAENEVLPRWVQYNHKHHYLLKNSNAFCLKKNTQYHKYVYIMFTSGTTGQPKGVAISHGNLLAYVENMVSRCKPTDDDRFTQLTELSFDFSVHDLFVCWGVGACLYVLPNHYLPGICKYIVQHQITYWASVPSTIILLNHLKKLKAKQFPTIKYSIFCGEVLTDSTVRLWHKVAPNSVIDNLYGPTEATVAISGFKWTPSNKYQAIPIGKPFMDQSIMINDPHLDEKFIDIADANGVKKPWYRTGDLVALDDEGSLMFKGRLDDQFKINGYLIQKIEVENIIKKIADTSMVAVIPVNCTSSYSVKYLIAFVVPKKIPVNTIINECRKQMPNYMIPRNIYALDKLPYNNNGKIDYQKLKTMLVV